MSETKPDQDKSVKEESSLNRYQEWTVKNPKFSIVIGVTLLSFGLILEETDWKEYIAVFMIGHLLIILGEVVAVTFFLHLFVDDQTRLKNQKIIDKLGADYKQTLKDEATVFRVKFDKLTTDLRKFTDRTVNEINRNLFEALLKQQMPYQLVTAIMSSDFFHTELIRRDYKLTFDIKTLKEDTVISTQRTTFELEYIFGKESYYQYNIPVTLTDTNLSKYILNSVGYQLHTSMGKQERVVCNLDNNLLKKNAENYSLTTPILIEKGGKVLVQQESTAMFTICAGGGVVDYYFAKHPTINMIIEINDLPNSLEFKPFPTFKSDDFKNPITFGTVITHEHQGLVVQGQGFGFSLSKKTPLLLGC